MAMWQRHRGSKHCHAYVMSYMSLASKGQQGQLTSAPVGVGGEGEEVGQRRPGRDEAVAVDSVHDGHRVTPHARIQRLPGVLTGP